MKDSDLKRNASGYYDETAYKAITAPPKAGEIWTSQDGRKCWLILRNNGAVCSTLLLGKEERENSIKVMGRVPMYTDPVMIGYTFTVYITTFVKSIPAANLAEVQKAVGEALGITATAAVPHDHINMLEEKVYNLTEENKGLRESYKEIFDGNEKLRIELKARNMACDALDANCSTMNAALDKALIYKELYLELIDKLVAVRGGAVND